MDNEAFRNALQALADAQYARDAAPEVRRANAFGALFVGTDLDVDFYLSIAGTVLRETESGVETISDLARTLPILAWASRQFPELVPFLPARQSGDADCPGCMSRGTIHHVTCPTCSGLGCCSARARC
jgi:hypothetical protein